MTPPPQPELFLSVKPSEIAILMSYSKTIADKAEILQTIDTRSYQSDRDTVLHQAGSSIVRRKCDPKEVEQIRKEERDTVLDEFSKGRERIFIIMPSAHDSAIFEKYLELENALLKKLRQVNHEP
jgi:hypothetical protein